jgi:hypothetical protein
MPFDGTSENDIELLVISHGCIGDNRDYLVSIVAKTLQIPENFAEYRVSSTGTKYTGGPYSERNWVVTIPAAHKTELSKAILTEEPFSQISDFRPLPPAPIETHHLEP